MYATLGAPGVYQATPCAPSRLPNVYVFPPEEDNQDVYCLFNSGSASPTTFESFYSHPVYTQRDPNSPTLTDLKALDHAISYLQRHSATHNGPGGRSWKHDERIQTTSGIYPRSTASSASSRSPLLESLGGPLEIEAETVVYSNSRHLGEGQRGENWQYQSNLSSRRSSVFGDRPLDYEAPESCIRGDDQLASRKSQTTSFRSRAAMAFKALGGAMTGRSEAQAPITPEHGAEDRPAVHERFEPRSLRKKRSRRTLAQLLNSHVDSVPPTDDARLEVASTLSSSSVRDPKLTRRKSVTQLFGLGRTSMEGGTRANSAYPHADLGYPAARSSSSLASSVGERKLSKRKSMMRLWGLGHGASSTELSDHTIVAVDADETNPNISEAPHVAAPRSSEGSYSCPATTRVCTTRSDSKGSQSVVSQVTPRKSFLSRRGFPFLDLHRHFATDHSSRPHSQEEYVPPATPAVDPPASFSPDSLSEGTDSSLSVAAIEDDMHFPVPQISATIGQGGVALAKEFEPNLLSRSELDLNTDIEDITFPSRFRLEAPDEDVESEMGEDPPTLELAMGLNSLTFDQLVFDPESFTDSVYD